MSTFLEEEEALSFHSKVVTMFVFTTIALGATRAYLRYSKPQAASTLISLRSKEFVKFQRHYLVVYLLAMFGDWLQGPFLYALYESYSYDHKEIATLFVAGFGASLFVGTFVGSLADKLGRRLLCQVFGVMYALCCICQLFQNYGVNMFGRLLGGISTSLLFSVFEAWMVCEHHRRGFHSDLLKETFALSTFFNGFVAVFAGILAHFAADKFGFTGPFILAIFPLITLVVLSCCWPENYGSAHQSLQTQMVNAINAIKTDRRVAALGAGQAFFEAAMYIFVITWVPAIKDGLPNTRAEDIPYGLMFAVYMMAMMVGSSLFEAVIGNTTPERVPLFIHTAALMSLVCSVFVLGSPFGTFLVFIGYEATVGAYFPAYGTLRSNYIGEEVRATVINLFRVPLNFMVILFVLFDTLTLSNSFAFAAMLSSLSGLSYLVFTRKTDYKNVLHEHDDDDDGDDDDDDTLVTVSDEDPDSDPELNDIAKAVAALSVLDSNV